MLFLHEVHRMVGAKAKDLEGAYRTWMAALARNGDARLLWFLHHAHGSGPSYQAITITGVADGAAWERLARRVHDGDLRAWVREVDGYRHDVRARLLMPLAFSPFDVELADVPTDGRLHEPTLYMEDTMWPKRGKVGDYVAAAADVYARTIAAHEGSPLLRIEAAAQTMAGAGRHPEVTLVQKVCDMRKLVHLLTHEMPEEMARPGTWMHDALQYRDRWRSKLLRTASWSPLF